MRVTGGMMSDNLLNNLNQNMRQLDEYNRQLSTGKKFSVPSHDPVGTVRSMDLETAIGNNEQYIRNIDQAINWMETTDSALNSTTEVLHRVREQAIYGANDSMSQTDRNMVAAEVEQLRENLVEIANTNHSGRFIFAGQETLTQPFPKEKIANTEEPADINNYLAGDSEFEVVKFEEDITVAQDTEGDIDVSYGLRDSNGNIVAVSETGEEYLGVSDDDVTEEELEDEGLIADFGDGESYQFDDPVTSGVIVSNETGDELELFYQGDQSNIDREITHGVEVDINVEGSFFTGMLREIDDLVDNLRAGETEEISNDRLANLDQQMDELLTVRSEVGAKHNRLEMTKDRLEGDEISFKKLLSENEDVDVAETIMNLKMSENVYRAALSSGARIIQPSLVDFLR